MDSLKRFSISIASLHEEEKTFEYLIQDDFFKLFEYSLIQRGNFKVRVDIEKRPKMIHLSFEITGTVNTPCDRCLDEFDMPVQRNHTLILKTGIGESDDPLIVFISKGALNFNIGKYIYEFIILSIPMIRTHDLAEEKCNEHMLKYQQPPAKEDTDDGNALWDDLKKIKFN